MIVVILLVFLLVFSLVKYVLHVQRIEKYVKNFATMEPLVPFIGNVKLFMGKSLQQLYEELLVMLLRQGTPFRAQIGPSFFIVVDRPEDMKAILMSPHCLDKPYIYDHFRRPLSIITQKSGKAWKPVRKVMNPMFNLKTLQSFLPILSEQGSKFVQDLECEVNQPHFDAMHYSNKRIFSSLCNTILEVDVDAQPDKRDKFIDSLDFVYKTVTTRFASPWLHPEFIYRRTNLSKSEAEEFQNLRQLADCVFENKKNAYLMTNNNVASGKCDEPPRRTDFPLMPMYIEGKFSEELVKQQIDVLLVAGHDTTASAVAHALLMLAIHTKIQDQVFDELRSVYDTQDQQTTSDIMSKLPLLDRVIKETLRHFPIVFGFSRTPSTDIKLEDGGVIPKGVTVVLSPYTMHRRRDIWGEDADSFNPDHFLPENIQKRHPYAYLPFSAGARNCIGYQYAMFTLKVILSALLRQYRFTTEITMAEVKPKFEVFLRITKKNMVKIERRVWTTK